MISGFLYRLQHNAETEEGGYKQLVEWKRSNSLLQKANGFDRCRRILQVGDVACQKMVVETGLTASSATLSRKEHLDTQETYSFDIPGEFAEGLLYSSYLKMRASVLLKNLSNNIP